MRNTTLALLVLAAAAAAQGTGPTEKPVEVWRFEEKQPIQLPAVVVRDRVCYVVGNKVVCRTAEDGDLLWEQPVKTPVAPVVHEDRVWVGLVGFRLQDGKPRDLSRYGVASTAMAFSSKGLGAVGTTAGKVAIVPENGKAWTVDVKLRHPALAIKAYLCAADTNGLLHMVHMPKQKVFWRVDLEAVPIGPPVRARSVVLVPVADNILVRSLTDGTKMKAIGAREISTPLGSNDEVVCYGTRDGNVVRIDPESREELGRISVGGDPVRAVVPTTGKVLYGVAGPRLFAVHQKTGERVWAVDLHASPAQPASAGNAIFVGAGKVFLCLR